jgi:threonine synthase
MLICASNANKVLTDFIRTGTYDRRRPLLKTTSPSMDILVSSNLERLLYLMTGDSDLVRSYMEKLNSEGFYTLESSLLQQLQESFWGDYCDDAATAATVRRVFREKGYLCDTHTAAGWLAAENYVNQTGDSRPMVVLSTASPYKFPAAVLEALGGNIAQDEFDLMEQLQALTKVTIPAPLASLRGKAERHTGVIEKEAMLSFVLEG